MENDTKRLELIRERVKRLERAEQDPHVKDWSGAYYGDVHFLLGVISSRASVAGDALEQIAIKLEFLNNASYGELRSTVETNREYTPAPNEPCIGQGDPGYRHFKNYATKDEWAVAERVSGWFQARINEIANLVEPLRAATSSPLPAEPPTYRQLFEPCALDEHSDCIGYSNGLRRDAALVTCSCGCHAKENTALVEPPPTPEQIVYNVAQRDPFFRKHLIEQLTAMGDKQDRGPLRTLASTPSKTPVVADAARAAAEEIREWIGISGLVDGQGINEVATIITRHLVAAPVSITDAIAVVEKMAHDYKDDKRVTEPINVIKAVRDELLEYLAATPSPETAVDGEGRKCVKCGHSNFNRVLGHCDEPGDDDKVFCDCKCEFAAPVHAADDDEGERKMYDDSQPVHAALSMLIDDGYATDKQRQTAQLALALIEQYDDAVQVAINTCGDVTQLGRFSRSVDPVKWVADLQAHLAAALRSGEGS